MKLFWFFKPLKFFNVPLSPDGTLENSCHLCVLPRKNVNFVGFFSSNTKFSVIQHTLPQLAALHRLSLVRWLPEGDKWRLRKMHCII